MEQPVYLDFLNLWIGFKNNLHEFALRKGWKHLVKWSYDEDYDNLKEEYSVRANFLRHPADTSTIVIIDNVEDFDELEAVLFLYTYEYCQTRTSDLALLWKSATSANLDFKFCARMQNNKNKNCACAHFIQNKFCA